MLITVLKSKIHRVRVTGAELNYIGSITIDEDLMEASGLHEGEKVLVVNNSNGERLETYVIPGSSGEITLNGAAARKVSKGDLLIIMSFGLINEKDAHSFIPKLVFPNEDTNLLN